MRNLLRIITLLLIANVCFVEKFYAQGTYEIEFGDSINSENPIDILETFDHNILVMGSVKLNNQLGIYLTKLSKVDGTILWNHFYPATGSKPTELINTGSKYLISYSQKFADSVALKILVTDFEGQLIREETVNSVKSGGVTIKHFVKEDSNTYTLLYYFQSSQWYNYFAWLDSNANLIKTKPISLGLIVYANDYLKNGEHYLFTGIKQHSAVTQMDDSINQMIFSKTYGESSLAAEGNFIFPFEDGTFKIFASGYSGHSGNLDYHYSWYDIDSLGNQSNYATSFIKDYGFSLQKDELLFFRDYQIGVNFCRLNKFKYFEEKLYDKKSNVSLKKAIRLEANRFAVLGTFKNINGTLNNYLAVTDSNLVRNLVLGNESIKADEKPPLVYYSSFDKQIKIQFPLSKKMFEVLIYDVCGKRIYQEEAIQSNECSITATDIVPGIYLYKILEKNSGNFHSGKFLIIGN